MSLLDRRLIATQGLGGSAMLRARQGLFVSASLPPPRFTGGFSSPVRERDRRAERRRREEETLLFVL